MYVGHLNQTVESLRAQWRSEQPAELHPVLDRIDAFVDGVLERGEHLRQHYSPRNPTALVRHLAGEMGNRLAPESAERLFSFYTYRAFDIQFRIRTLQWAARWARITGRTFKLYGKGWAQLPELAPFAAGPIEHGETLRKAYRCAKFAIQTMPAGFQHQRSLEAIASGCLVLSRYIASDFEELDQEEARKRQEAGKPRLTAVDNFPLLDQVVFRTPEEFASTAQRLLDDPGMHRRILADFRDRVLKEFSYDQVMPRIIGQIRNALQQQARAR
jgi:hypothetical protein